MRTPSELAAVLESGFAAAVADIQDAIRIPGVSKTGEGLDEMAAWVAAYLRGLGAEVSLAAGEVAPIVHGRLGDDPAKPTLLFYDLYDVQPADAAAWSQPPFAGRIVDGHLIGRGAFNSKGPLVGFLGVLRDLVAAGHSPPCNFRFVIEGEEEIGSPSLAPFMRAHAEALGACDAAFIPYLGTNAAGETILRLGFKGLMMLELAVAGGDWGGPRRGDVHAMHAGWLASPAMELVAALASLQTRDGRLTVDGLATAPGPDAADRNLIAEAAAAMSPEAWLDELGAARFKHDADMAGLLERFLFDPTLNIDALRAGETSAGGDPATALLHRASALLDLRLVPGMGVEETVAAIRAHLDARGFGHVALTVRTAYPASKVAADTPVVAALADACRGRAERFTMFPIHAGAAPMHLFGEVLSLPYAFGGVGHGGLPHAPDEYLDVESMRGFRLAMADFLHAFADRAR